jgi:hypothetical protein
LRVWWLLARSSCCPTWLWLAAEVEAVDMVDLAAVVLVVTDSAVADSAVQ